MTLDLRGSPGAQRGADNAGGAAARARLTANVRGFVQGVGFRWWVRSRALELGLTGSATNLPDGRVEVVAEGPGDACAELLALLRGPGAPGRVTEVTERWSEPGEAGAAGFAPR
jgi:acylphosphatase